MLVPIEKSQAGAGAAASDPSAALALLWPLALGPDGPGSLATPGAQAALLAALAAEEAAPLVAVAEAAAARSLAAAAAAALPPSASRLGGSSSSSKPAPPPAPSPFNGSLDGLPSPPAGVGGAAYLLLARLACHPCLRVRGAAGAAAGRLLAAGGEGAMGMVLAALDWLAKEVGCIGG